MDWSKGIVAIFISLALFSPTICIEDAFSVRNLNTQPATSECGTIVTWDQPTGQQAGRTVAEYVVELRSGNLLIETQTVDAPTTQYTFTNLPQNTPFTAVVYSCELYGATNQFKTCSQPVLRDFSTPDSLVTLTSRTDSQLVLAIRTPDQNAPTRYHVTIKDVLSNNDRTQGTTTLQGASTSMTISGLDTISGVGFSQYGRLIEITVRAEDQNGAVLAGPDCFRTLLDASTGATINSRTSTSLVVRTVFVSRTDFLEYVIKCADSNNCGLSGGELRVTAANNAVTTISNLPSAQSFTIQVFAGVGERHRNDPSTYSPQYTSTLSAAEPFTLVDIQCQDGGGANAGPNKLAVTWSNNINIPPGEGLTLRVEGGTAVPVTFADSTQMEITGLTLGTEYTVQLSQTSNGMILTAAQCYTALPAVTSLFEEEKSQTSVKVSWTGVSSSLTVRYELTISPEPANLWKPKDGRLRTTQADVTEYTLFGLNPNVAYTIGVYATGEDSNNLGPILARSASSTLTVTTAASVLSVSECSASKQSVTVSWTFASTNMFKISVESNSADTTINGGITPMTEQTVSSTTTSAVFRGLTHGHKYKVTLREVVGTDMPVRATLEFKCRIAIGVTVDQSYDDNPRVNVLNFGPADGINYEKYRLQVLSATPSSAEYQAECDQFKTDFGCKDINFDLNDGITCPCGKYWVDKPARCSVNYQVAAYQGDDTPVSNVVGLSATDTAFTANEIYEMGSTDTSISFWWAVSKTPNDFDYYYLEVTDPKLPDNPDDDVVVYCTTIPCPANPTDAFIEWEVTGLNPGVIYAVKLERWLYSERVDPDVNNNALPDNIKEIFTALGVGGAPGLIYELGREGSNLEFGWARPPLTTFTQYEVCIEPTKDPAGYQPTTLNNDIQQIELTNVVDADFSSKYRWGVATRIVGANKWTQYSNRVCDNVDLNAPQRGQLQIIDAQTTTLQVQWQKDGNFLPTTNNYRIIVRDGDLTNPDTIQIGNSIDVSNSADQIQRTISNLTPGTYYCIQVLWRNTEPQVDRVVCGRTCPNQPASLQITSSDLTTLDIAWDDAGGHRDFYLVYATDTTAGTLGKVRKGRVLPDATSFKVEELIPNTNYVIELVALSGTEEDNKESQATTVSGRTVAIPACNVIITSLSTNEIEVRWGPCPEAGSLQICPRPGPPPTGEADFPDTINVADRTSADRRVYTFLGLRAAKKYSVFLRGTDGSIILSSATKYTEPFTPNLAVIRSSPTSLTLSATSPAGQDFPDDMQTVTYQIFDPNGELINTLPTNGQDSFGERTWRDLKPNTNYMCRASITAGTDPLLSTPSDPMADALACPTAQLAANKLYVQRCDQSSVTLVWGDLVGNSRNQIEITPPPVGASSPYRFDISENSARQIGNLRQGQEYTVKLLQGSSVTPTAVDEIVAVTKPTPVQYEVLVVDQTSIDLRWSWPNDDEYVDFFAINHTPVSPARTTPSQVPFWKREYKLQCLLPGRQISVGMAPFIRSDGEYFFSPPYSQDMTTTTLPSAKLDIICVCVSENAFTVAWSTLLASSNPQFHGYQLNLLAEDTTTGIDEIKVARDDSEHFHHFYNLGDEYNGTPYTLLPTTFYVICVRVVSPDASIVTAADSPAYKVILTKPKTPANLRRVTLDAPESKTSLKVEWDGPDPTVPADGKVDYYKVYYNRFGDAKVYEDIVDPRKGDPLCYTLTGLDPSNPTVLADLDNPKERPPAYSVWVVAVYTGTFKPPTANRKKRQLTTLPETTTEVESEPKTLEHKDGIPGPILPKEILAQKIGTTDVLALFGASPADADPNGKYRFFIDTPENPDPFNPFIARGGSFDVANSPYFFDFLFENLFPGTVFKITLSTELEEPNADGDTETLNSILVLTCPAAPTAINVEGHDAVSTTFTWPKPIGLYTEFEVTFKRPNVATDEVIKTKDLSITFDNLFPDMEYTVTIRTCRTWEPVEGMMETKYSELVMLTTRTADLRALQIAIQDHGTDFINIVFGKTIQNVVYEVSIDPGNCPCGWKEFMDSCYYIASTSRVTYDEAQAECQMHGANLASILNEDEQNFVAGCLENDPDSNTNDVVFGYWIGLNDKAVEGTFVYEDGQTSTYRNWRTGQPDDATQTADEDCVSIQKDPNSNQVNLWADVPCGDPYKQAFICERAKARPGVNYPVQPSATTAHEFMSLVPGQCYRMKVDADLYSPQSEIQRTNPLPVTAIMSTFIGPVNAHLSWTLPTGIHDGFYVTYVPKDTGDTPMEYPYKLLKGETVLRLYDLVPDTDYVVKVYTVSSYGACDEQKSVAAEFEFRTVTLQLGVAYIKSIGSDSIKITWGPPASTTNLAGFRLTLCPDECVTPSVELPDEKSEYTFTDLVPGKEYSIIFRVLRSPGNNDAERLLTARTLPLPVRALTTEKDTDSVTFKWEPPAGGEYDQYLLTYSTCDCSDNEYLQEKVLDSDKTEYKLHLDPSTVAFASLKARSQVECAATPYDSHPQFIYGVSTDNLAPLQIYISKRGTNFLEVYWGAFESDTEVTYKLSWYKEENAITERDTKYTKWLIQGLTPGDSYYINVQYANLESPNKGFFPTAIYQPTGLTIQDIMPTSVTADWQPDATTLTEEFWLYYEPYKNTDPKYQCAAKGPIVVKAADVNPAMHEAELKYLDPGTEYRVRLYGRKGDNIHSIEPAEASFTTDTIEYEECRVVSVNATNIAAVWDSVTNPPADIFKYKRIVRIDATDEEHGKLFFSPSAHPYVSFDNLWPGQQYEVCCTPHRINMIVTEADRKCSQQVTAPETPFTSTIHKEHHQGFCVKWAGPYTNFDNYVIKITDEDGNIVYPAAADATLPAAPATPVYESLPKDVQDKCIAGLLPGMNYTVNLGTWVNGQPAPQFSEPLEMVAKTVPLAPLQILVTEQTKNKLVIIWGAIPNIENPEYRVTSSLVSSTANPLVIPTNMLTYTRDGLMAGQGYNFKVEYSNRESPNTGVFYTVPCPPENPMAINTAQFPTTGTRVSLQWGPPADGQYDGFRISYRNPDSTDPEDKIEAGTVGKDARMFTATGLFVNQEYTFCIESIVDVENERMPTTSDPIQVTGSTTTLGPLVIEISKRGTNSFHVGWGPTTDSTCLAEGEYVVTAKTQADTIAAIDVVPVVANTRTNSVLIPVNSGIEYNIQVVIGTCMSEVISIFSVPEKPGSITLTQATSSTIDIAWGPADNFVGEYEITYSPAPAGFVPIKRSPQDRKLELEALLPNTEYMFTVVNTVGEGVKKTDSEPSTATFRTRSAVLTIVDPVTTNSMRVWWTPEVGDFDSYLLRVIDTDSDSELPAQEIIQIQPPTAAALLEVTTLIPGTKYRLELYTLKDGVEQLSDIEEAVTFPEPPENIQLRMGTYSTLTVGWEAPERGIPPAVASRYDGFEVTYTYSPADGNANGDLIGRYPSPTYTTDTDIILKGLLPNREFVVTVRTFRQCGDMKIYSTGVVQNTFKTSTAEEGKLVVRSVTDMMIGVFWTAITGATNYNIQLRNINTNEFVTYQNNFPGLEGQLNGLVPGAVYNIQLRAVTIDEGDTQIQATIPHAVPALTSIQRSIDSITLKWNALDGGLNGEATGFIVSYTPKPEGVPPYQEIPNVGEDGVITFTLDNLLTDQLYEFTIVSYTDYTRRDNIECREKSAEFKTSVRTYDLNPAQIQILELQKESVCFKWGGTDSGAGTQYELRLVDINNSTATRLAAVGINEDELNHCFNNLEPGTLYELTISVTGTLESAVERFRTKACVPLNLREVLSFQCSISIAWDPADGHSDSYRVFYRKTDPVDQEFVRAAEVFPTADQALEYTLEDLEPEKGYEFRVQTIAGGSAVGELQEISQPAVIVVFTDAETLFVTQVGSVINVAWPSVDGSAPYYELYRNLDDGDQPSSIFIPSTGQRLVELTGLTAGQQYNLVLNAVTQEGVRTLLARTCFTLQPPPIPNNSLQVTGVANEPQAAVVTFNNPILTNTVIGSLRLVATPGTPGAGVGNPVELTYIVPFTACPEIRLTGLCPDTYYVITVFTLSGATTVSEPVTTTFTTPPATPGQISFGDYTATSIQTFWADGLNTDYTVRISYEPETAPGTSQVKEQVTIPSTDARTYTFENLVPGVLYTVTVSAAGNSNFLDRKAQRTRPIDFFGALRASHVGHNSITIAWPTAVGVDGYEVCYFDVQDQETKSYDVGTAFTESTIQGLLPKSVYAFSVASYIGDDNTRSTSNKLTIIQETAEDPAVPAPVNLFVSSFTDDDATLQWEKPAREDYDYFLVEYTPDDSGQPSSPVLLPRDKYSLNVRYLIPSTNYVFTVTALRGRAGLNEERSQPATAYLTTAPHPFVIDTLQVTDTKIEVTWGPHASDVLANYEVSYTPEDGFLTDPSVAVNEPRVVTLQNLQPDTEYHVTVTAKNADGDVLNLAQADLKTYKLPVRSLKAKEETTSSALVYWPPAVDELVTGRQLILDNVAGYRVIVRTYSDYRGPGAICQQHMVVQSACPSITLRGLDADSKYYVMVFGVDAIGDTVTAIAGIVIETLPPTHLNLRVSSVDSDSIEVEWSPAMGDYSNYLLSYTPAGSTFPFALISKDQERKWRIEGLLPGQLYTIKLQVQSIENTELYSASLYQFTTPVAPSNLVFSGITDTGFNAAWPAVITGRTDKYGLCVFPDPKDISVVDVFTTTYDLEDLYPSTNHLVSVYSTVFREEDGKDVQEVWSMPVSDYQETTVGEPGVPIVVSFDETTIQISWVRVEGAARYFIRRSQLDGSGSAQETVDADAGLTVGYTFEDLIPGEEYLLFVRPDTGGFQEKYTKQRTNPLSPLFVRTEFDPEDPTIRVITWQPPGEGRVDRYEIFYSPGHGTPVPPIFVDSDQPLRQEIANLDPNIEYLFIVTSEAGVELDQIRTRSEPAVADLDVVVRLAVQNYGHYAIDVAWPELPGDFDSYVISYEPYDEFKPNTRPSPVEIGKSFNILNLNLYGLTPGEEYTVFLQTKSGQQVSDAIQQVIQTTIPLSVDNIRVDLVTASSFHFSWNDPDGDKDRYQVFFKPVADANNPAPALGSLPEESFILATGGPSTVEVTGLEAGQDYEITVVTWSNEEHSYGTKVIATTRPLPPSFVEVVGSTTRSGEIQWYDGAVGNRGISKYEIEVVPRENTRPVHIDAATGRNTHIIEGLTPGTAYQVLIRSIVIDGKGDYLESLPVSVAFVTTPLPPIFKPDYELTANSITIRWHTGGGHLTSYSIEYSPVPENPSVLSPILVPDRPNANLALTVNGLSANTEYTFTIKAITRVSVQDTFTGTFDVIKESQTNIHFYRTLPNQVPSLFVTSKTSTSIGLSWTEPDGPVHRYILHVYEEGSETPRGEPIDVGATGPLEYAVSGLDPDTEYHFEIYNQGPSGSRSAPQRASATTNEDVSGPPSGLTAEKTDSNSIRVEWNKPEHVNGDLEGYILIKTSRSLEAPGELDNEAVMIPPDQHVHIFEGLHVGYEYTFTISAINNIGEGEPLGLGEFIQCRETAPPQPPPGIKPYKTPETDRKAYTISIRFHRHFFSDENGPVANYSIMVVEEPNPKLEVNVAPVGNPPPSYNYVEPYPVWPAYQASRVGYNPFRAIVKRQADNNNGFIGGDQSVVTDEADFVIGVQEVCTANSLYCNGPLEPYTCYRTSIRAYGLDGAYTDTQWSEPICTGWDRLWFVYGLVGIIGLVLVCLVIILCVCCNGGSREEDPFADSTSDDQLLMKEVAMPMESKNNYATYIGDFTNYSRPSPRPARSEKPYNPPAPKRSPPMPKPSPPAMPKDHTMSDNKPKAKLRVYGTPTSHLSKPIYINQFGEHMRMMNANGGMCFSQELDKLNEIGGDMSTNSASNNTDKNRYRNILPYDSNRVTLRDPADGRDYINASFVDGHTGNNEYIVTQGPLPSTIEDFWEMIWENEIPTVIMNTNLVENGRVKCEKYWPDSGESQYGRMTVKLISESDTPEWTVRTVELAKNGESRGHVRIFQYRNWPDQGAPRDPRSVLKFLQTVRAQHPRRSGPGIVVHCSAGVGRSGTFVAIDTIIQALQSGQSDTIDIMGIIARLRRQRRYMVQSEEQLKFVHRACQIFLQQQANFGSNWAMGSSGSNAGPAGYTNDGMSVDGEL